MKIVVPMAGRGSRFESQGFDTPKPLIPVAGRPMVAWALQSLVDLPYSQIIFVALAEHEDRYGVTGLVRELSGGQVEVVLLDAVTDGQLCTVLAASEFIDLNEDLLIAASDTYVESDLYADISRRRSECAGIISVADMPGDRWSFVRTGPTGRVVEVAEKRRISDHASTGLYYFANGRDFVSVANEIVRNDERTRGEFYVIPVYQKYVDRNWRVDISVARQMWDMGTPEALAEFQQWSPV